MSEIIRWALALVFLASLWGMAAFLIYKQVPGWGWFLVCVTLVMSATRIKTDCPKKGQAETQTLEKP